MTVRLNLWDTICDWAADGLGWEDIEVRLIQQQRPIPREQLKRILMEMHHADFKIRQSQARDAAGRVEQ